MEIDEITNKVIRCAYDVGNEMGYGFAESVYEKCMLVELKNAGLTAESQKHIRVFYKGIDVGDFFADILVNHVLIVEIKRVVALNAAFESQLVNYLHATKIDNGLLINFATDKVEIRRKFRQTRKTSGAPDRIV